MQLFRDNLIEEKSYLYQNVASYFFDDNEKALFTLWMAISRHYTLMSII